jgi:hypothetical protein
MAGVVAMTRSITDAAIATWTLPDIELSLRYSKANAQRCDSSHMTPSSEDDLAVLSRLYPRKPRRNENPIGRIFARRLRVFIKLLTPQTRQQLCIRIALCWASARTGILRLF